MNWQVMCNGACYGNHGDDETAARKNFAMRLEARPNHGYTFSLVKNGVTVETKESAKGSGKAKP